MQRDWKTSMKGEQFPLGWKVTNQVQDTEHFNPFSVGLPECLLQSQERAVPRLPSFLHFLQLQKDDELEGQRKMGG